ncbi:MAG: metallophosphatase domain-containing protein [Bacteroidales bacterium]|jgi:Icc-related predicted phosphoesterase|nr:metallophosphatase domain-containing protein [Bacteroidales bacterium]
MKILHLSDTHAKHLQLKNLPQADIIIRSGDASFSGTETEVLDFLNWFCDLDYRYKIFVAGNHDDCLFGEQIEGLQKNVHYLCNSGVKIEGFKFWGIPLFMGDAMSGNHDRNIQKIPADVDVLISHNPPHGMLDCEGRIHYGCPILLQKVLDIRPKYHLFGHIHAAHGIEKSEHTTFVNSAIVNEQYEFANEAHLVEIPCVK